MPLKGAEIGKLPCSVLEVNMPNKCIVESCKHYRDKGSGISFHKLPRQHTEQYSKWVQWLEEVNAKPYTYRKHDLICSTHFHQSSFYGGYSRAVLKPDACPSIPAPGQESIHIQAMQGYLQQSASDMQAPGPSSISYEAVTEEKLHLGHSVEDLLEVMQGKPQQSESEMQAPGPSSICHEAVTEGELHLDHSFEDLFEVVQEYPQQSTPEMQAPGPSSICHEAVTEEELDLDRSVEDVLEVVQEYPQQSTPEMQAPGPSSICHEAVTEEELDLDHSVEDVLETMATSSGISEPEAQSSPSKRQFHESHHFMSTPQKRKVTLEDHSYSSKTTPRTKLRVIHQHLGKARRKLYATKQVIKRREKKIQNLQQLLSDLKKRNLISDEAEKELDSFGELPDELLKEWKKNQKRKPSGRRYTENFRKFATTLHFYSPRAYKFLSEHFPMPREETIRSWLKVVEAWPGFTAESLHHLKEKHKNATEEERLCSIMMDGMSIRKKCELDQKSGKVVGYVNFGQSMTREDCDDVRLATDSLVLMAVGVASPWKLPIAYFLNNGCSGDLLKSIITDAIENLEECGLHVVCIVCDGLASNVSMGKLFGCHIHVQASEQFRTWFPHPTRTDDKVFVIFDAAHALKLLRNLLGDKGSFYCNQYGVIQWSYIVQLHELQDKEGFRAANKLTRAHIDYRKQIMKVRLAAETFSGSVSLALKLARTLGLPSFQGSEGTENFLEDVNEAFDLLNSYKPHGTGSKAPLHPEKFPEQKRRMLEISSRLMALRLPSGRLAVEDGRRMSVISLAFTLRSVAELTDHLFLQSMCRYICTYRLSQDHLETFFGCVRQRGGWNNNPSALQFRYAYRALLVHADVSSSASGNVAPDLEGIVMLRHQGTEREAHRQDMDVTEESPGEHASRSSALFLLDHDYGNVSGLTDFSDEVMKYIGGVLVGTVCKKITCSGCLDTIVDTNESSILLFLKES